MNNNIATDFGNALRFFRLKKHFSQDELSAATNIGRSFISELENGRKVPSLTTIYRLAQALDISMTQLIQKTERYS